MDQLDSSYFQFVSFILMIYIEKQANQLYNFFGESIFTSTLLQLLNMAEVPDLPLAENLNTKNGNFICGVVEGTYV